jgi:hypothetical protein
MRKYASALVIFFFMLVTFIQSVSAHEFDSLGLLVRHKENTVSLISAPPLEVLEINEKGEKLDFDSNRDGEISFQEIREFEDDIAKRVEQLVVFQDEQGRVAKLMSFRLLEKGYENLLKIETPSDSNNAKKLKIEKGSDKGNYIQLSLKFQWDKAPQSIHLSYDMLIDEKKNVLVRNQDIGESQVLVLASSEPSMTIFPISNVTAASAKGIWLLGVEHVFEGLDHLLFILALTLVCKSLAGLIAPLSAFTIAHSLALGFVVMGFEIGVASWLIEVGIAMTIVIMALFELLGWKPKHLFLVTALMGVIHGIGLGQALTESMNDIEGLAMALVQVTVGIELAQLAVALIFLTLLIHLPRLANVRKTMLERGVSSFVICVGFFWAVTRLLA